MSLTDRVGVLVGFNGSGKARRAVNQANYNKNEISSLDISLPNSNEQIEIASQISLI